MCVIISFTRELDHAMLRRLEKRILVDLPTEEAREAMFRHHLPTLITPESHGLELRAELDYKTVAKVSPHNNKCGTKRHDSLASTYFGVTVISIGWRCSVDSI